MADDQVSLEHHLEAQVSDLRDEIDRRAEILRREVREATATQWPMVGILATLAVAMVVGFWSILSIRFDEVDKRLAEGRENLRILAAEAVRRGELLATKTELDAEIRTTAGKLLEQTQAINMINSELIRRRSEFVEKVELAALEKRLDERAKMQEHAIETRLSRATWEAWRPERDALIAQIMSRLDRLERTRDARPP